LILAPVLLAQRPQGGRPDGPGGRGGGPPQPILRALDTDHDGTLSAQEIAAAPKVILTLDKNGDGTLTADELMPRREGGPPGGEGGAGRREGGAPAGEQLDESTPSPDD